MARWKLTASHYLKVEGTFWEQVETDQLTGQQLRKRYPVPLQLDIKDDKMWNDNIVRNLRGEVLGGDIVVAYADKEHGPRDYLFTGDPTPDMFPLDDEAREISETYETIWNARPDEDISYDKRLIEQLQTKMQPAEAQPVKIEGLSEILQSMAAMMEQNQQLIATLSPKPEPSGMRRT